MGVDQHFHFRPPNSRNFVPFLILCKFVEFSFSLDLKSFGLFQDFDNMLVCFHKFFFRKKKDFDAMQQ